MTNSLEQQYNKIIDEYRSEFPYLSDHRYELLTMAAGNNVQDIEHEQEALKVFGLTMDGFTQYSRKDIEEIC